MTLTKVKDDTPERIANRARNAKYRTKNKEDILVRRKIWLDNNPDRKKSYYRNYNLGRFGLTMIDYDRMFTEQNGVCAICEKPETHVVKGTLSSLKVDHNHNTDEVRALLCNDCNLRLGRLLEDKTWTEKAIAYLLKYGSTINFEEILAKGEQ